MIALDYADLLSGEPILIPEVGHVRSPKLSELAPATGIGFWTYNFFLGFLSWDKSAFVKYTEAVKIKHAAIIAADKVSLFMAITILPQTCEAFRHVLQLFIVEDVVWDEGRHLYAIYDNSASDATQVGSVNSANFEDVRRLILQFNYIGLEKKQAPIKHSSQKAQEMWDAAQKHLAKTNQQGSLNQRRYAIGNIISKLCAVHNSYNLLNVFNLTVFQLYDQFIQCEFMRGTELGEQIFCAHGGDNFTWEKWLDPINDL